MAIDVANVSKYIDITGSSSIATSQQSICLLNCICTSVWVRDTVLAGRNNTLHCAYR